MCASVAPEHLTPPAATAAVIGSDGRRSEIPGFGFIDMSEASPAEKCATCREPDPGGLAACAGARVFSCAARLCRVCVACDPLCFDCRERMTTDAGIPPVGAVRLETGWVALASADGGSEPPPAPPAPPAEPPTAPSPPPTWDDETADATPVEPTTWVTSPEASALVARAAPLVDRLWPMMGFGAALGRYRWEADRLYMMAHGVRLYVRGRAPRALAAEACDALGDLAALVARGES